MIAGPFSRRGFTVKKLNAITETWLSIDDNFQVLVRRSTSNNFMKINCNDSIFSKWQAKI